MESSIKISFIIPVFNRPKEVEELLSSMEAQSLTDFEIIIVEDGSSEKCEEVVQKYKNRISVQYFYKDNSGPGQSRNYGAEKATGNYFVFLDSDCVLPPDYFKIIFNQLLLNYKDAFGGPDMAHTDFSDLQKAINYSMTSFFTTGGIRGGSEKLGKFHPRSFNMGYSRKVFEKTGGFSTMRFGEDIDMSIRIIKAGFSTSLIKEAAVYHKRRTSLIQFYKQVMNSGIARINLYKRHPESLKIIHFTPALFVLGLILCLAASFFCLSLVILPLFYAFVLLFDATLKNKSFRVGCLSLAAGFIQLFGYGVGFIRAFWKRIILKEGEFEAFKNNFYK